LDMKTAGIIGRLGNTSGMIFIATLNNNIE
jgi:hypothetical protein